MPEDRKQAEENEASRRESADLRAARKPVVEEDPVEEASDESFPASDPPSFSPLRSGPPREDDDEADKT